MWVWVQCSIYDVDGGGVLRKNIMLGLVALFQLVDDAVAAAVAVAAVAVAVAAVVDPEHQIEMPHKSLSHFLPSSSTLQGMVCNTS